MTTEGQHQGWYLICAFCRTHKIKEDNICPNCGATVRVIWETQEVISPELVMVMR